MQTTEQAPALNQALDGPYRHGFVTDIESETAPKGLNEDIIRMISAKKNEPEWLLDFRLKNEDKHVGRNKLLKMEEDYLKGITIFKPKTARDGKERPSFMPTNFSTTSERTGPTIKDLQEEHGGAGVFYLPPQGNTQ